jgi:hypothetical protein
MSSEANKQQIDGTHYKTAYEHWDYALDAGLGVLEYAATKHLGRYHKKGEALKDLRKARHYVQKLTENITVVSLLCPRDRFSPQYLREVAGRFLAASDVRDRYVVTAVWNLTAWQTAAELRTALSNIDVVIEIEEGKQQPDPVPLEDSNKHANRSFGEL